MHADNRIWLLMARCLSKEASQPEREELQAALRGDQCLQQEYAMLQQAWTPRDEESGDAPRKFDQLLAKARLREVSAESVSSTPVIRKKFPRRNIIWIAAASVVLMAFTAIVFYPQAGSRQLARPVTYNDSLSTQHGNRSHLILPDGSRVWLNSGSRLLYQKDFSGAIRQVELVGEGFFQVVKSNGRPFIVHAGGVDIRVLGTTFNVKCYPKDENVETTLLHGAVSVSHPSDPEKRSILLKPNEKLSIRKEFRPEEGKPAVKDPFQIAPVDTTVQPSRLPETAWVYNRLEFRGDDFATLAEKMERWYNVKIRFREEKVKKLRFIGSFENETVDQALIALQAVSRFNYKIRGNEIFISPSY